MNNVASWQSPAHQGMPSPTPGQEYSYEQQYAPPNQMYGYANSAQMRQRAASGEPNEHYDPRQQSLWPQPVQ